MNKFRVRMALVVCFGIVCVWCLPMAARSGAQEPLRSSPTRGQKNKADPKRVLASVGEKLITQADVDLDLGRTASGRNDLPDMPEPMLMTSVEFLALRLQTLESLKRSGKRVSAATLDKWLVENSPPDLKLNATQALAARAEASKVTPESYRDFIAFRLSWLAYTQTALTDKNIEKHFNNQKSRFDGTRFEVEHLWMATIPGKSAARTEAHKKLGELRLKIVADQMTMAEAAQSLLEPDTNQETKELAAKEVGPVWITGGGPLMPRIVDEVLKTPAGKISEPFDSATAVHVVKVNKIEPGSRKLSEVQDEVRQHMLLYLLEFHASKTAAEMPLVWLAK